jgi:hypothetical protein
MDIAERREKKFNEIYDKTLDQLEYRRRHDSDLSIEDIERQLETMYVDEGNDWTGRGLPGETVKSATIAATEAFLERLRASRESGEGAEERGDGHDARNSRANHEDDDS